MTITINPDQRLKELHEHNERILRGAEHRRAHRASTQRYRHRNHPRRTERQPLAVVAIGGAS